MKNKLAPFKIGQSALLATSILASSFLLNTPVKAQTIDLSELGTTHPGFRIEGIDAYDRSGVSVSGAGDVNGDGLADLIIGARLGDPGGKKRSW